MERQLYKLPAFRLPVLMSYSYIKQFDLDYISERSNEIDFLIDSGAFTAFKSNKPIHLPTYIQWLKDLPIKPTGYMALDVVKDPVASRVNYDIMREHGLTPIPVWTYGAPLADLRYYLDTADRVAIGGLTTMGGSANLTAYLVKLKDYISGYRVHMLGMTNAKLLRYLKPCSVDSSSYTVALRYGGCAVYLGAGRMTMYARRDSAVPPSPEIANAISRLGIDVGELRKPSAWIGGRSTASAISTRSWISYSQDVQRNLSTVLYLAAALPIGIIYNEYQQWKLLSAR